MRGAKASIGAGGGIARESDRYRIGPLTKYVDPEELRRWHLRAPVGEDLVYAIGPALGANAAAPRVARELAEKGEATLLQRREAGGIHYVIRKRARPEAVAGAPRLADAWHGKPEGRVLAAVIELATAGLPLPTYDTLAEACQLADGEAVRYRLGVLSKAGVIRLYGPAAERIIEVCGTALRTAKGARR